MLVLVDIENKSILLVDHFGYIINLALVIKDGIALQREVCRVPSIGVVDNRCDNVDPKDE